MNDIQKGDVVVCVDARSDREWRSSTRHINLRKLRDGGVYRVTAKHTDHSGTGIRVAGVEMTDFPGIHKYFDVNRFRKIRPADPEFIELVKRRHVDVPERVPA